MNLFVLGFPSRQELILQPLSGPGPEGTPEHLHNQEAVVTAPLRRSGTIEIDGLRYGARSESGAFIDADSVVVVACHSGSILIVTELCCDGAER